MKKYGLLILTLLVFNHCKKEASPTIKKKSILSLKMDSLDIAILQGDQNRIANFENNIKRNTQANLSPDAYLTNQILLCGIQINKGEKQNLDSVIEIYEQINGKVESTFGKLSDEYTALKGLTAWAYGYLGNLDKEMSMTTELLKMELESPNPDNHRLADYYNTIGMNYNYRGENLSELLSLKKALTYLQLIPDIKQNIKAYQSLINVYSAISLSYLLAQDHVSALFYSNKCIEERNKSGIYSPQIAINYMIVGRANYALSKNYDTAMYYLHKAVGILETSGMKGSPPWISYQGHIADIDVQSGNIRFGLNRMRDIITQNKLSDNPEIINVVANNYYKTIKALIQSNQFELAAEKSNEAILFVNQHVNVVRPYMISLIKGTEAQLLSQKKQWQQAETIFEKEIHGNGGSMAKLISQEGIPFHTPQNVIPIYLSYANMYYNRANETTNNEDKIGFMKTAINSYKKVITYYNNRESFYSTQNLNQSVTLDKNAQIDIFEKCLTALNTLLEMNNNQLQSKSLSDSIYAEMYTIIEASKANVLQRILQEEDQFNNLLPVEVNAQRKQKADELNKLGTALRQNFDVQKEIELQGKFNEYKTWLAKNASTYKIPYQDKNTIYSYTDFLHAEPNNLVCNYFLGRESLFCMSKLNNSISFYQKPIPSVFIQHVNFMNEQILSGKNINNITKDSIQQAEAILKKWYALLLDDKLTHQNPQEIVIIPSRQLFKIPFDLLIDTTNKYLIESIPIRYELSGTLMCKVNQQKVGKGFAGFASSNFDFLKKEMDSDPSIAMRGGNYNLPQTAKEVDELAKIAKGKVFKNTTPQIFKANAQKFGIIHVATHAFASNNMIEDNYLAFEQDNTTENFKVTSSDVQQMGLHANFCMLASCESGSGYIDDKEGAMSIGKSFIEAGVPSVGISLWKLPDNENTVTLISNFYSNMLGGMTKAKALQQAKLSYLKSQNGDAEKLPFYWAGLAIIGNNNTLTLKGDSSFPFMKFLPYVLVGLIGFVAVYFISRKRKSA